MYMYIYMYLKPMDSLVCGENQMKLFFLIES